MKYIVTLNGKKYEVEVENGNATAVYMGKAEASAAAPAAEAAPAPAAETKAAPAPAAVPAGEGDPIKSPMPGTILDVRVAPGQNVKEGETIFVLEAMKMENEIVAPKNGQITSVTVTKGASVQTEQVLATLK